MGKYFYLFFALFYSIAVSFAEEKIENKIQVAELDSKNVNVDMIKEKYWARGNESEMGVVQNRLYSKENKLEFGLLSGIISSDPFLNTKIVGGSLGFHFSEYFGVRMIGWKNIVSPSTALKTFEDTLGATTNNNPAKYFLGAEGSASVLYGKLSLIGKAIIYYDFHLLGGMGLTGTESGTYFTPYVGLGQNVYLSKNFSLRIDYRLQRYNEKIIEKVITPKLGQVVGERVNWSNAVTLGVNFLFGGNQ